MNLPINLVTAISSESLSLQNQELSETLLCNIVEIQETHNYALPTQPLDNGELIRDTIYNLETMITARVFVLADDIVFFERSIQNIQNSDTFFKITSLYSKSYDSLKLLSWSADTNSNTLNGRHFYLQLQEIVLVEAQVQPANLGNASYSDKSTQGTKRTEAIDTKEKKSALLKSVEFIGG